MDFLRIWFCCCILICIYCQSILWLDDQYEVTYYLDESNGSDHEPLQYLGCLSLNRSFQFNRTEIEMGELRKQFTNALQQMVFAGKEQQFSKSILKSSKSNDLVVVFRDNVCLILSDQIELIRFHRLIAKEVVMFAYKPDTFDWTRMEECDEKFHQLIVLNEPHPYSNCAAKYSGPGKARFHCLNDCFKRGYRLSEYFYLANESGPLHLKYRKNQTMRDHEDTCFEECDKVNCKLVYLYPNESGKNATVRKFKARPMLNKFDFNVQMVGLIFLILNMSLSRILSVTIEIINLKLRSQRVKACLFYLRLIVLFVFLLCCTSMFVRMILAFKERATNPTKKETTRNILRPELIHLCVCVPVEPYVPRNFLDSMNMLQLEMATDRALNETIDSILFDYKDRPLKWWPPKPKVLFYKYRKRLHRCFQLEIDPTEPRYRMQLSISKLKVRFKPGAVYELFLLAESENGNLEILNQQSFRYTGSNAFRKRVDVRSRYSGNCIDYEVVYREVKCTTRQNCVEQCIQTSLFDLFGNLTSGTDAYSLVIDKDQLDAEQWQRAYLDRGYGPGEVRVARNWCLKQIPNQKPCVGAVFEESVRINQPDENTVEMEVYYELVKSVR